jgi:hypothetical protein
MFNLEPRSEPPKTSAPTSGTRSGERSRERQSADGRPPARRTSPTTTISTRRCSAAGVFKRNATGKKYHHPSWLVAPRRYAGAASCPALTCSRVIPRPRTISPRVKSPR